MGPTLLIALAIWIGLNVAVFLAFLRGARERCSPGAGPRNLHVLAVDGYAPLLLSRLLVQTCRVVGVTQACLLLRDPARHDALVPVASHGLDEGVIGRRMATDESGWTLELVAADGTRLCDRSGVALPVVRTSIGDCGYLWAAAGRGAQLGHRQARLLEDLAALCARVLDDVEEATRLDKSIGRALALVCEQDDPAPAERYAGLVRAVGERLGLDGAALIELDVAAHVQHAAPIAPAAAVRALAGFEAVEIVLRFARERWDGGGPQGLRGDRIPLGSRILAVCEALEVPADQTLRAIQGASGSAYDPAVVTALSHELLGPIPEIDGGATRWADGDRMFASVLGL